MITIACCCPPAGLGVLGVTCELTSVREVEVCLTGLAKVDVGCLLGSKGDGICSRRYVVVRACVVVSSLSPGVSLSISLDALADVELSFVVRTNLLSAPADIPVSSPVLDFFCFVGTVRRAGLLRSLVAAEWTSDGTLILANASNVQTPKHSEGSNGAGDFFELTRASVLS